MGKRLPIKDRMKLIIEALRAGEKTWTELINLGIPNTSLEKDLDRLAYWGLVKKEEEKYVWYKYSQVLSPAQFALKLAHSRKLLPALDNMLDVASVQRHPYYSYAKEHLWFYPEIYQQLVKFEEVFNERVRYLLAKHGDKILKPGQFMCFEPLKTRRKGFLGKFFKTKVSWDKLMAKNLPYLISADYPGTDEEWKKTEEYKEILELKDFLDNNKSFNKNFPEYRELAKSIYALKMDIELGFNPLKGKCSCPPNVKIEENKS